MTASARKGFDEVSPKAMSWIKDEAKWKTKKQVKFTWNLELD